MRLHGCGQVKDLDRGRRPWSVWVARGSHRGPVTEAEGQRPRWKQGREGCALQAGEGTGTRNVECLWDVGMAREGILPWPLRRNCPY